MHHLILLTDQSRRWRSLYVVTNSPSSRSSPAYLQGAKTDLPGHSDENVFDYMVSPKFRLGKDQLLYARIATGYQPVVRILPYPAYLRQ